MIELLRVFVLYYQFSFIEKFGIGNERHFWITKVRGFLKIASEVELRILVSVGRGSWLLRALNLGTMIAKDVVNTFYTAPTLHWQSVLFIFLCTFACFFSNPCLCHILSFLPILNSAGEVQLIRFQLPSITGLVEYRFYVSLQNMLKTNIN